MGKLDDWISRIGYYNETEQDKVRLLVYGETGCGKTTLAASFPHPFFVDTDRGGRTLKNKRVPHIKLERGERTYDLIMDILRKLKNREAPFDKLEVKTLVFDSITSLADHLMVAIMLYPRRPGQVKKNPNLEKPEWDDYTILRNQLRDIMITAQDLKVNVVGTCGEQLERDEVRGTFVGKPSILGSYRDLIGYAFDEYYHMTCEGSGDKVKYVVYTAKHLYYTAKSRDGMPVKIEDPTWAKLFRVMEKADGLQS